MSAYENGYISLASVQQANRKHVMRMSFSIVLLRGIGIIASVRSSEPIKPSPRCVRFTRLHWSLLLGQVLAPMVDNGGPTGRVIGWFNRPKLSYIMIIIPCRLDSLVVEPTIFPPIF